MKSKFIHGILLLSSGCLIANNLAQDTPPQYVYQVELSRTSVDDSYDELVETAGSNKADAANVTWLQTIDQDTTLYFWWSIGRNWKIPRRLNAEDAVNFCDGPTMDPGSMTYHALKVFSAYLADGSDCPIEEETLDIPVSEEYTFKMNDKMLCGKQGLSMNIGREKDWSKADLSLSVSYTIPEDSDCEE